MLNCALKDRTKEHSDTKRELLHYIHCHDHRYIAHTDSFKLEIELKETIRERISELEGTDEDKGHVFESLSTSGFILKQ